MEVRINPSFEDCVENKILNPACHAGLGIILREKINNMKISKIAEIIRRPFSELSKISCLHIILLLYISFPLAAKEYYVDSQNGDDSNNGTSESTAWRSLEKVHSFNFNAGDIIRFQRGGLWRGTLKPQSGYSWNSPITYTCYGSDALPKPRIYGSKSLNQPADWIEIDGLWRTAVPATEPGQRLLNDVGNMIFINASGDVVKCGIKCWKKAQLTKENRFWHDPETAHIWYCGAENPALTYSEVEAALRTSVIESGNNIVISEFDVRYSGAHGFQSGKSYDVKILNCDISWCGGCWQETVNYLANYDPDSQDGDPHYQGEGNTDISVEISPGWYAIRFGNGIEFWTTAENILVEGCRVWEIFDAAITNQGTGPWPQRNITWRNNIIWDCEWGYEYWSCGDAGITENILLTNNVFLNSGGGWGHGQRRDQLGHHLVYYCNAAPTSNFKVINNVLLNATQNIVHYQDIWVRDRDNYISNYNVWGQLPGRPFVLWGSGNGSEKMYDFHLYQEKTGMDVNSIVYDCTVAPALPDAASGVAEWAEYEFCDCLSQPSGAEQGACLLAWLEKYDEYRAGYVSEVASITLNVYKDVRAWSNHGKTFTLKRSDDESISKVMTGADNTLKAIVLTGAWKLYEGNDYTGITFNIDKNIETTLDYYTVTYQRLGVADGVITADYDGEYISSGALVLGGKTLTLTASSSNTSCTYAWSGTASGTDAIYTTFVNAIVNAYCRISVITGVGELPVNPLKAWVNGGILHVSGLTVGKVWNLYSISGALVKQGIAGSEPLTVNLEHTGVYIVRSEGHTYTVVYH